MSINFSVYQMQASIGDINTNLEKIKSFYLQNKDTDVVVTPELSLSSYLPKDYLYYKAFANQINIALNQLKELTKNNNASLIIGCPLYEENKIYNCAFVITNGNIENIIYKYELPNTGVFNEHRWFTPKESNHIIEIKNKRIGIIICEDTWHLERIEKLASEKPDFILSINASPFTIIKHQERVKVIQEAYHHCQVPIFYLNLVGGFDEIVFDGSSFLYNDNQVVGCLSHCAEDKLNLNFANNTVTTNKTLVPYSNNTNELIYSALVKGTQDFIYNSGFTGALLGLSGGIDSALTATIVCDALGPQNVMCISLPSEYTSTLSKNIIEEMHNSLGFNFAEINISSMVKSSLETLQSHISLNNNTVEENLQARVRGQTLMAWANANSDYMLLTTGNKSEYAVGYSTIYGDSCGMFNIIKDLYKTQVFELAKWRNNNIPSYAKVNKNNVIPQECITRKPSAELKNNQYDEDNLLDYFTLDKILFSFIEEKLSKEELYGTYKKEDVEKIVTLVGNSQYKRVQSAPGLIVSTRPLSLDFQYPLATKFKM